MPAHAGAGSMKKPEYHEYICPSIYFQVRHT